jgi:hypothetical protein
MIKPHLFLLHQPQQVLSLIILLSQLLQHRQVVPHSFGKLVILTDRLVVVRNELVDLPLEVTVGFGWKQQKVDHFCLLFLCRALDYLRKGNELYV